MLTFIRVSASRQTQGRAGASPLHRRESILRGTVPPDRILYKETVGSPKFPSYPRKCMPCSPTPVVSAILRHSVSRTAAFHLTNSVGFHSLHCKKFILKTTIITISGLNHTAYILDPSGFVLPLLGLHADFTTDLLARL